MEDVLAIWDEYRLQEWSQIIQAGQNSGLSKREFCRQNGLSERKYYSLIETGKENHLDPYKYLLWVLQMAPELSRTDEDWAEHLLPALAPQNCKIP